MAQTPTLIPAPGANELQELRFLDALESEGASSREFVAKHWAENLRQVRGEQWRLARPPHFMGNITRNAVERKVAALTEVKPMIRVVPTKADLDGPAHVLTQTTKAIWDAQHMDQTLYRLCYFAMTLGSGFLYTYYDPSAANQKGDIIIKMVDPRHVLIDPAVTEAENLAQAAYVMVESFDTLSNIRMRYPGRGLLVKPDRSYSSLVDGQRGSSPLKGQIQSAVMSAFPRLFKPGPMVKEGPIQRATIKEYFIADPQLGQDGQPAFPNGRHVIRAGDVILKDEPNPYWDGQIPVDMFDWSLDFDTPWGVSEVAELRRIQEAFNRIGDGFIRNALISNNVKVIGDMNALDQNQWDQITNQDGIIIKKRPGTSLDYQMPGEMPQYLFPLMTMMIQLTDLLTGNMDPSVGKKGSGITSAAALEGLQASAQTLIRSVARRLEGLLERVGQKLISRIYQFYNANRVLHMLGPSHDWISYTFERMKLLTDDNGHILKDMERSQMFNDFRFLVSPGSSLASTRVQRTMMLLQMKQALGIAPSLKRIISESDIGDPELILEESLDEMRKYGLQPPQPGGGKKGKK